MTSICCCIQFENSSFALLGHWATQTVKCCLVLELFEETGFSLFIIHFATRSKNKLFILN